MNTINIHVRRDGRILALGQAQGGFAWYRITAEQMQQSLQTARGKEVVIAYSRDDPDEEPPRIVETIFRVIAGFKFPMQLLREPAIPVEPSSR
jgi:hypothetical protein